MKRLIFVALLVPHLAAAQLTPQPPSGAMKLLGRCTTESAQLLDQIAALEMEIATAKRPMPPEAPPAAPK